MDIQILKVANDYDSQDANKFIGVYVCEKRNTQLMLLSISEGVSKSTLLRRMVDAFLSPRNLPQSIAERVYNLYQMKGERWSDFDIHTYKMFIKKELSERGLESVLIDKIITLFEKLANEAE